VTTLIKFDAVLHFFFEQLTAESLVKFHYQWLYMYFTRLGNGQLLYLQNYFEKSHVCEQLLRISNHDLRNHSIQSDKRPRLGTSINTRTRVAPNWLRAEIPVSDGLMQVVLVPRTYFEIHKGCLFLERHF
jgi:hypothetical protein